MPVCDLDKRAPVGKKVMGLDVVVWWDNNENAWKVFDDMCPHRLAPLSEGRIDEWGRLQCVYHGWYFGGSGDGKLIPQAPLDGPPVHSFQKACVGVYPSTVQNEIVWFWPNTDPQYKDILTKKKPPYIPELDDPSFTFQMFHMGEISTKATSKGALDLYMYSSEPGYWSHVVNCSSCKVAYKSFSALKVSLQLFSIASVAIVAATKHGTISVHARNALAVAAILCFMGSKWLSHFIYKKLPFS
ncbi:hypothetical protein L1987_37475 [Smallanthus sonchifolius]|uniref:Uncharacterized protein n=1 Tax=Smallanthus sonchifolius TaxID=185202 RepID=A0ACB9HGJ7_9ASTR|nr:hypothetical protein L1987_37475 [Smallanthus sonchifolius]